jgi:hypothetical protein
LNQKSAEGEPMLNLACPPITAPADAHKQKDDDKPIVVFFHSTGLFCPFSSLKNYIHHDDHAHEITGPDILLYSEN